MKVCPLFFFQLCSFLIASLVMTVIITICVLKHGAFWTASSFHSLKTSLSSFAPLGGETGRSTAVCVCACMHMCVCVCEHRSPVSLCEPDAAVWLGARRWDLIISTMTSCCVEISSQVVGTLSVCVFPAVHLCTCVLECGATDGL